MNHVDYYYQQETPNKHLVKSYHTTKTLCGKIVRIDKINNHNPDCQRCKQILAQTK